MTGPQILKKVPKSVWSDPAKAAVVLAAIPGNKLAEMDPGKMEPEALASISDYFNPGGAGNGSLAHIELTRRRGLNPRLDDKWSAHVV
jgi:hypothetical protein